MHEYRVTKYDPSHRDDSGAYLRDEWTSFADVGRSFGGIPLTLNEYERIEAAYVRAAEQYLAESSTGTLSVHQLEDTRRLAPAFITEGASLPLEQVGGVLRGLLREEYWCRIQADSGAFIHVGWDYYMYIGVPYECPASQRAAEALGLFVEEFDSPYGEHAA
jgi:hypothetical protein